MVDASLDGANHVSEEFERDATDGATGLRTDRPDESLPQVLAAEGFVKLTDEHFGPSQSRASRRRYGPG